MRPQSSPKSLANLPSVLAHSSCLHGGGGNGGRRERKTGRDGSEGRERLEGERIYLNISGNLGTKHASAGVISSPHATEMQRVRTEEERERRLSLYLLEISLVLAFIAAACIPARCAYASVYRRTYTTRGYVSGDLYCAMPGAKRARRGSPSLPFIRASR